MTPLLDIAALEKVQAYIESGDLEFDFKNGSEEQKGLMLDYLEKLMDLAELADATATRLIFKDSYLGALTGMHSDT